ncbi:MAG TPA: serine/threonine-protein kinase, partial [Ktedonobacteraceae bacterium]
MQRLTETTIGRYRLLRCIGYGGISELYLAWDRKTAQRVAIKFIHVSKDDYYTYFQREVRALSALRHEHILPALDYGRYKSWLYLVTPYIAQGALDERLAAGPLSYDEAGEVLQQLADALQFAHEHGVIHRNIKPSNVLLAEGMHAYLADFGLVKSRGEAQSLTRSSILVGTPVYMAPEMADGRVTPASDIYALGVLLYQMLTGQLPFQGDTPLATARKRLHEVPVLPSTLNPAIPPAVDDVILRVLEEDPDKRFKTSRELAVAYQNALSHTVDAVTVPIIQPSDTRKMTAVVMAPATETVRKKKKAALLTVGLCAGLCSILLLFGIFTYEVQHQSSASSSTPDRPATVSPSPRQTNPPSTAPNGGKTQSGNTYSQGSSTSSQTGNTYSQGSSTSPRIATPPPPKHTPPPPP